ncbi:MAG: prephenate dehydrogenase/arogenate dehydrogenase family protein [Pseudohongiella sp.]|nr:prephenate dehydrogenase/arogenate dehydrogenase family protein [Pseudohongiella sp.]
MNLLHSKTVLIIGLGLIGGSIARGLAHNKQCKRILAHGRDSIALQSALNDGSIDAYSTDLSVLAPQADIIVICTPTLSVRKVLEQLKELADPQAIITDAASVKSNVVADARALFPESLHRFVPGHPIAGSEQSGYAASKAELFNNRKVILTPLKENSAAALQTVMALWQVLGADVHAMSPERHDVVLAGTSHLPHLLAYSLVNTLVDSVSQPDRAQQVFDYAAGGFADFSRIASSDPVMWRDIFLANKNATIDVLDSYIIELQKMRHKLMIGDGQGLQSDFSRAKMIRDEFIKRFRTERNNLIENNNQGTHFTVEPEEISVFPGSFLTGSFSPPADSRKCLDIISQCIHQNGVFAFYGVPESLNVLAYLRSIRSKNVPVVGPESGYVRIYGVSGQTDVTPEATPAGRGILKTTRLPADVFLCGLLVLGAGSMRDSHIRLSGFAETRINETGRLQLQEQSLLAILVSFGFSAQLHIDTATGLSELIVDSFKPAAAKLDIRNTSLDDNSLLIIFAAAVISSGTTTIALESARIHQWLDRLGELAHWAATITVEDDLVYITRNELKSTAIHCHEDPYLALTTLVIGQTAPCSITIKQPGELAGMFPGLLAELSRLGFGFTVLPSNTRETQ